jgi:hypothetical protein
MVIVRTPSLMAKMASRGKKAVLHPFFLVSKHKPMYFGG